MFEYDGDKVTLAILRSLQEVARPHRALQGVHNSVIIFSFIDSLSSIFALFETTDRRRRLYATFRTD